MELEHFDEELQAYLPVRILRLEGDDAFVQFASGDEDYISVDTLYPAPVQIESWIPQKNENVQVQSIVGGEMGQGWFEATVTKMSGDEFMFVHYAEYDDSYDEIVVRERIRKGVDHPKSLKAMGLKTSELAIPENVAEVSMDLEVHQDFRRKTGLISVAVNSDSSTLQILGSEDALQKAQLLSDLHFKRLDDIKKHEDSMKYVNNKFETSKAAHVLEFSVDKDLMGNAIGKGGANIKEALKVEGIVDINTIPNSNKFKIVGKTQEAVDAAKTILDIREMSFDVEEHLIGAIIGQNARNINDIIAKSGVGTIRVLHQDRNSNLVPLSIIGQRAKCENALLLLEYLKETVASRHQRDNERQDIETRLRNLGLLGRGRGGGGRSFDGRRPRDDHDHRTTSPRQGGRGRGRNTFVTGRAQPRRVTVGQSGSDDTDNDNHDQGKGNRQREVKKEPKSRKLVARGDNAPNEKSQRTKEPSRSAAASSTSNKDAHNTTENKKSVKPHIKQASKSSAANPPGQREQSQKKDSTAAPNSINKNAQGRSDAKKSKYRTRVAKTETKLPEPKDSTPIDPKLKAKAENRDPVDSTPDSKTDSSNKSLENPSGRAPKGQRKPRPVRRSKPPADTPDAKSNASSDAPVSQKPIKEPTETPGKAPENHTDISTKTVMPVADKSVATTTKMSDNGGTVGDDTSDNAKTTA